MFSRPLKTSENMQIRLTGGVKHTGDVANVAQLSLVISLDRFSTPAAPQRV